MTQSKPLVLDVDGTLLKTNLTYESFWAGLGQAPLATLGATLAHLRNPPRLKRSLSQIATLRTDLLPINPAVASIAEAAIEGGSPLVLASRADVAPVRQLAEENGLSTEVFGSDGTVELKGKAKAAALVSAFGRDGFHYVGSDSADRPVWEAAEGCILVGRLSGLAEDLKQEGKEVSEIETGWRSVDLIRAMRPHQWVKNLLLLVPLLAAHVFLLPVLGMVALGMLAFSAAASAIYIVNDLLDLEADRLHVTKRKRPFASGAVPIKMGMRLAALLALLALGGAVMLGWPFFAVLCVYMALSLGYSLRLKQRRWIDLFTLAALYVLRVVAGAAVAEIELSGFLLVWIFPIFVTLAAVKRLTELTLASSDDRLPGRGYGRPDRVDLLNIAWLGTVSALLIFLLYSFSPHAAELYPLRWLLWVALLPMALWLIRMVRLGWLGEQDHDPILFALSDLRGLGLIMLTLSLLFYAAGIWQQLFGF